MIADFPVGDGRAKSSALNPLDPLRIRIAIEPKEIELVDCILFTIWGADGQRFSNRIDFDHEIEVAMDVDCYSTAMAIGANVYTVSLALKDKTERIIAKGKVIL